MTRRELATWALLWFLLATSVAAGIIAGGLILGSLSPVAASRPALASPSPSGELMSSSHRQGGPGRRLLRGLAL